MSSNYYYYSDSPKQLIRTRRRHTAVVCLEEPVSGDISTGLETFGRHLLHDQEYPPPEEAIKALAAQQQQRRASIGDSPQVALEHFAQHLLHSSEGGLENLSSSHDDPAEIHPELEEDGEIHPQHRDGQWKKLWNRLTTGRKEHKIKAKNLEEGWN